MLQDRYFLRRKSYMADQSKRAKWVLTTIICCKCDRGRRASAEMPVSFFSDRGMYNFGCGGIELGSPRGSVTTFDLEFFNCRAYQRSTQYQVRLLALYARRSSSLCCHTTSTSILSLNMPLVLLQISFRLKVPHQFEPPAKIKQ